MAFDFTGKTAIVTGGTQGIGLEIAKGIVAGGGHAISSMSPMHPRRARLSSRFLRTCRKPTS